MNLQKSIAKVLFYAMVALFTACSKDALELKDSNSGFDPETEGGAALRSLQLNGVFFDEDPLVSDTAGGKNYYLTSIADTMYAYEGIPITLKFGFIGASAGYSIQKFFIQNPLETGYWDIGASSGNGFNVTIPSLVRPGKLSMLVSAKLVKYIAGIKVDSFYTKGISQIVELKVPDNCDVSLSGRNKQGLIYRKIKLGNNAGKIKISFLSMDSATSNKTSDRFDFRYNNTFVMSSSKTPVGAGFIPSCTGLSVGAQKVQGWKEYTFTYDPKNGTDAELYIQSNCTDTTKGLSWQLKMQCAQ